MKSEKLYRVSNESSKRVHHEIEAYTRVLSYSLRWVKQIVFSTCVFVREKVELLIRSIDILLWICVMVNPKSD